MNAPHYADPPELATIEEADAWVEYLEATRTARRESESRYREVEPWAWARLAQRKSAIAARRKRAAA